MDTINKSISKKIDFLRTLMIVFVLFIHNTNTISGVKEQLPVFWAIQQINLFLFSPAVPLLYFISAYLLFMKNRNYCEIIIKRIRQILVPFLLWPTIILILYLSFNYKNIRSYDFIDYLDAYLGIFNRKGMLLPHFWFLRDLFILTLLYPIFSKNKVLDFIVFGFAIIWWLSGKSFIIGYNSLFYYMLGYFAAKYNFSWYVNKTKKTVLFFIISLLLSITGIIFTYLWKDLVIMQNLIIISLGIFYIIIANYCIGNFWEKLKKYSFWIYCIHLPILMTVFIKALAKMCNLEAISLVIKNITIVLGYYLIPVITIAIAIYFAKLLCFICPRGYALLSGERK